MSSFSHGGGNGSMQGREYSPAKKRRIAQKNRAQEKRWAAKAGPVTVRYVEPKVSK